MKTLVGVLQARMGSTRLPGKVLRPLYGHSVLSWVIRAIRTSGAVDDLVVATTGEPSDDPIVRECEALGVAVHRGPVDDVLSRFLGAVENRQVDAVLRFTADCPLLDPGLIAMAAQTWRAAPWVDYVSTALPRCVPRGMDIELIAVTALRDIASTASGYHRTHVTSGIYADPGRFRLLGLTLHPDASDLRVTLDTEDDFALIETLVKALGDRPPTVADVVGYLREHPEVTALNAHVRQKPLVAG